MILTHDEKPKFSIKEIILRGSLIAVIISIPSLFAFVITWMILDDLTSSVIIGMLIHFILMGFSLKISKKLLVK